MSRPRQVIQRTEADRTRIEQEQHRAGQELAAMQIALAEDMLRFGAAHAEVVTDDHPYWQAYQRVPPHLDRL